jgi:hypothetical protein
MAAPNIVNVATITAKTDSVALSSTGGISVLSNASNSGIVMQVVSLYAANVDGSAAADVTVTVHNEPAGAGTGFALASTVVVPADASVVVIDKNSPIFLEEAMSIKATPSAADDIEITVSYQEIS